ncbi:solute carrier family 31 (copper transporter), member 1 [Marchantia polymorpha subsp. ruderalis]|nr:hypothetical protein MARPO_0013s0019 [Marchantia polymorpha]BBN19086.1 hypothetical protein Mp_8g07760 [Marchantia polymorpha subsp. ruderalis]|eukprot:PTQ45760.1 hypothetical protein MARPO_0013s0019 [Marchantia polymorpha]
MSHDHGGMDMGATPPTGSPTSSGSSAMDMVHMMQMTFYWGKNAEILFDGWKTDNVAEYVFSLLAIFLIAVFHEWLSTFRADMVQTVLASKEANGLKKPFLLHRLLLTSLFAVNAVTGYALMLMAMTFNGGIFIVIIAGLTAAHFCFQSYRDSPVELGHHV